MIITILICIITLMGLFLIYLFIRNRTQKLNSLVNQLKSTKQDLSVDLEKVKSKIHSRKLRIESPELIEPEPIPLQQKNLGIVCAECLLINKEKIENYLQHKDDLPLEGSESDNNFDGYGDTLEVESPEKIDPNTLITTLDTAEEYAKHILDKHLSSHRVDWAKEYLEAIKDTKKNEPKPRKQIEKPKDEELELIPVPKK